MAKTNKTQHYTVAGIRFTELGLYRLNKKQLHKIALALGFEDREGEELDWSLKIEYIHIITDELCPQHESE